MPAWQNRPINIQQQLLLLNSAHSLHNTKKKLKKINKLRNIIYVSIQTLTLGYIMNIIT